MLEPIESLVEVTVSFVNQDVCVPLSLFAQMESLTSELGINGLKFKVTYDYIGRQRTTKVLQVVYFNYYTLSSAYAGEVFDKATYESYASMLVFALENLLSEYKVQIDTRVY